MSRRRGWSGEEIFALIFIGIALFLAGMAVGQMMGYGQGVEYCLTMARLAR